MTRQIETLWLDTDATVAAQIAARSNYAARYDDLEQTTKMSNLESFEIALLDLGMTRLGYAYDGETSDPEPKSEPDTYPAHFPNCTCETCNFLKGLGLR